MVSTTLAGLSLRDLEYAVAVGELRHFGHAAERCGVSQSALSEQIRKLEAVLGVALFERTKRRVDPTPRGAALLRRAEAILVDARGLIEAARVSAEPLTGPLRLGVIATLGPYYVPSLLSEVRSRFPSLVLQLREAKTADLLAFLRRGECDAILVALPLEEEGLVAQKLFFEPFLVACPAGHALQTQKNLKVADLGGDGLLLLEEGHCLRDQALALCQAPGGQRAPRFASSLEMLRHMIAAGEGFSLLPALAAGGRPELDALMCLRRLDDSASGRMIGLVWRGSDPRRAEFETLRDFLCETAPSGTVAAE